jgi:hypothetical protein
LTEMALTDGAEAPDAMPTLAFQPMIAPSSVAKRKVAGIPSDGEVGWAAIEDGASGGASGKGFVVRVNLGYGDDE